MNVSTNLYKATIGREERIISAANVHDATLMARSSMDALDLRIPIKVSFVKSEPGVMTCEQYNYYKNKFIL